MATSKNTPDNKSTEQRGKQTSLGNTADRANSNTRSGDRATTDETRNAGLPDTQRKGAETTQAGTSDRNTGSPSAAKMGGDRTDRELAGSRTTGQNPTGSRDTNDGELRDEDEEDVEQLPTSEDVDADDADDAADTDGAKADKRADKNTK